MRREAEARAREALIARNQQEKLAAKGRARAAKEKDKADRLAQRRRESSGTHSRSVSPAITGAFLASRPQPVKILFLGGTTTYFRNFRVSCASWRARGPRPLAVEQEEALGGSRMVEGWHASSRTSPTEPFPPGPRTTGRGVRRRLRLGLDYCGTNIRSSIAPTSCASGRAAARLAPLSRSVTPSTRPEGGRGGRVSGCSAASNVRCPRRRNPCLHRGAAAGRRVADAAHRSRSSQIEYLRAARNLRFRPLCACGAGITSRARR